MAESEEELKSLLMKVKEESEKAGLKLSIQKTKIMESSPITSWQIDGETMETMTDFIFLLSQITADGDCRHEIKRCFLLGKKAMTNLDSSLKSRDFTLPTKVCLVKAMVFPVVMYECESWTIKKAEKSTKELMLLNMLSWLVITFLPRIKRLLISWLQSPSAVILESKKIKSVIVSIVSPSICHEVMGLDAIILVF